MALMNLVDTLFRHGLGELPVFYRRLTGVYLGNMVYEKGRLFFKDRGLLSQPESDREALSLDLPLLGMVCHRSLLPWQSLTFCGIDCCAVNSPDLALRQSLEEAKNEFGDRLIDFVGSIYRAYYLMLEHRFLPVVVLQEVRSEDGEVGLGIADLRAAQLSAEVLARVRAVLRAAIARQAMLGAEELEITQRRT